MKINREIRDYQESIFFGLNLRQLVFSILAIGVAVGIYFGLNNILGTETVSWMCVLGAAPFAAMGFIRYNADIIDADRKGLSPYDQSPEALEDIRAIKAKIDAQERN